VQASDLPSTTRLVKETIQLCYDARDYKLLNANIHLLSKKHGQLKAAIQAMVEQAIGWLEEIKQRDGTEKWLELIETLRSVSEGKVCLKLVIICIYKDTQYRPQIFLETPRARVTLVLAHYHESLANAPKPESPPPKESIQTASDLLSELQVETYSSMERREKTEFILEQMRFLIMTAREKDKDKGVEGKSNAVVGGDADWVKVRVSGRKVSEKFLEEKENEVCAESCVYTGCEALSVPLGSETQILRSHDPI
jgi:26S proteasome regulatory subunit N5